MKHLTKVLKTIQTVYRSSFLCKICSAIANGYKSSLIFSLNTAGDVDAALGNSVIISNRNEEKSLWSGVILNWMNKTAMQLIHIPTNLFFILFDFWFLSLGISQCLQHQYTFAGVFFAVCILCLPLCFVKCSLMSLFSGTLIGRALSIKCNGECLPQNKIILSVIGIIAISTGMFLTPLYSFIAVAAVISLLLLVHIRPIYIISLIMICLPIFGTSVCITLSIVLLFTHLFQRLIGTVKKRKIDYIDLLLAVFAVLCIISSVFSFSISDSLRVSLMWCVLFMSVFIIYRNVNSSFDLKMVLFSLLAGSLIACAIGLFQYFSGQVDTTWTDTTLFEDLQIRIYSTFANPNVFGEFLLLVTPLFAGLGIYCKNIKAKVICFVSAAICLVTLALTYSRGCYVGIAVTVLVFLWMYNKKILGALIVLGLPVGIAMVPQNMIDRILSMGNLSDSSTSYRLKIYEGTFGMLGKFWQSGVGIGETAFNYVYPYFGTQGIVAPHSHSLFLQIMTSFGIAGLLYFVILLFIYHRNIISSIQKCQKGSNSRILLIMFGSVLSGFLAQSIFDYTWYNYRVYMLFWIVLALGFSVYRFVRAEEKK